MAGGSGHPRRLVPDLPAAGRRQAGRNDGKRDSGCWRNDARAVGMASNSSAPPHRHSSEGWNPGNEAEKSNDRRILRTPNCVACLWWSFPQSGNGLSQPLDSGLRRNDGGVDSGLRRETTGFLGGSFPIRPPACCRQAGMTKKTDAPSAACAPSLARSVQPRRARQGQRAWRCSILRHIH